MDAKQVTSFCNDAVQLVPALAHHAAIEPDKRTPEDEALIRQLRVAAGALAHALMEVPRQQPPQPAIQPQASNVGAPS
jgi:hypothetical protein